MMPEERIKLEYMALNAILPKEMFKFLDFNTSYPYVMVGQRTNSGKLYTIRIDVSGNYPYSIPKVFITNPKPLCTCTGASMLDASHPMHTLTGENGCVRVCHYGAHDWTPRVTIAQIVLRVRVWLEMYEAHLKTGRPMDYYLKTAIN
ncbi:MAG: hypothetical protein LBS55_05305 [Prevotellaceae bacterium]|jgi:ubiquitin-protein ligase|nr:hypothetical protein [Prevotellaceae bacterium]